MSPHKEVMKEWLEKHKDLKPLPKPVGRWVRTNEFDFDRNSRGERVYYQMWRNVATNETEWRNIV